MAERQTLDPPLQETRAPQLGTFDWQHLERLTEALLNHEPDVGTASQYGTSRQTQFGIDTKAELKGGGCDVASCKRQARIGKNDLATWSTDFLDHWDSHWKAKYVRRFILSTTAPVDSTRVVEAADVERLRFAAIGLEYELWGQPQLIEKMRPHRGIVAQFVGTQWVDLICGPQQREALQPAGSSLGILPVGAGQLAELRALLSGETEKRIVRALDDLRAGDLGAVERTLADLRAEPLWSQLEVGAQARVLRFAASAALNRDDIATAIALSDQADALQSPDEPRIAARIAYQKDGARAGLAVLGVPSTRDGRQLQVALLLTVGDLDQADATLAALLEKEGPDPETTRLQAWVLLMRDRRKEALALAEQLEQDAGHWIATVRTSAIIRYANALSPMLGPEWFLNASPVDLDLVREDDEGRAFLARATADLKSLVERTRHPEDRRWLLASLSNQRDRWADAETLAGHLNAEAPADPVLIAWSLARRFEVDLTVSRAIYADKYASGETEQIDVRIHALMLVSGGDHARARTELVAHLDRQKGEAWVEAETWIARLTAEIGDAELTTEVPAADNLVDDIQRARQHGDWAAVGHSFDEIASGAKPQPQTLLIAQLLAAESQWAILAPHRDAILSFGTAESVRIVAYLIASTDTDDALVEFVAAHRGAFPNGESPPDVRRLIVDRQRRAGDLVGALSEARALSAQSGRSVDRQLEAQLRASIGDTAGAAEIVRDLLRGAELTPDAALRWGETLRANDILLAQELWRFAVTSDADRRHAVSAYFLAFSLGLEQEARPLFSEVTRAAATGSPGVRTLDVSELPDFLSSQFASGEENRSLYLDGRVPAHLYAEQENQSLDDLILEHGSDVGPLRIRLLRNGARPRHIAIGIPWSQWRLHMDISAILIAAEFDLLDIVEQHPYPVTISSSVPAALLDMQRRVTAAQPARLNELRQLSELIGESLVERRRQTGDRTVGPTLPDQNETFDLDPAQLLEVAFRAGAINKAALLTARSSLLSDQNTEHAASWPPLALGDGIWLAGAAAEQVFQTGVLPSLCLAFDVGIDPEVAATIRAYVATEGVKAERAAWLDALRERLRIGIEAGRYLLIRRHPECEAEVGDMASQNAATVCLMDTLIAEEVKGAVSWFEDRNLTGYPINRNHAIVELIDVLNALAAENVLSEAEVRARISRFLGAGGGLVQIEVDDVAPAILTAPIVKGILRETPALVAIRRNRAATRLLDGRIMVGQTTEPDDHRPDESRLLTNDMRLVESCLTAIWSDPLQTVEDCIIRSEWVWSALRIERSLRNIPEDQPGAAARNFATLCFASAIESLAMPTDVPVQIRRTRRRAFAQWFWQAVLARYASSNPDIIERIAAHIEQLYLPRLNGRDPTATKPAIELELIKIRVAALPPAVMNALAAHSRFGSYLGLKSEEVVTIRRVRFEASRFWRAVRTARRYGKSKIRTVDGRRCRITRTDNGIAISGAVRARLADSLCGIFDPDGMPAARFERLLDGLELTVTDHARFLEQGRSACTPNDFSRVLMAARKRSAKATYDLLEEAFQPNRPIAGEAFLPPPASALLHYLRTVPGDAPFHERLHPAITRLEAEVGALEAFRRLSGLPISNLLGRNGHLDEFTEVGRAVTPIAVYHWAEMRLAQAATSDERGAVLREALARFDVGAAALVAILNWAVRAFWRDEEFRSLDASDRLALVWVHSHQVLDAFLRRNADPELVARFFTKCEFNEVLVDRLNLERFMDRDVSSPSTLNATTLTFHLIGALLGDAVLEGVFDASHIERLQASFTVWEGEVGSPAPAFTTRNFDGQNLLGSVLSAAPDALRVLACEPGKVRAGIIDKAIEAIRSDRDDALSWAMLLQHARTGLTEDQLCRTRDVLLEVDLTGLAMGSRDDLPLPRMIVRTMGLILPPDARGRALDVVRAVARSAAAENIPAQLRWEENESGTLDPIHELLEICGCYAGIDGSEIFDRFESAALEAIGEWPKAVPAFREMIDQLIRTNGVVQAAPLWRLHLHLNACP